MPVSVMAPEKKQDPLDKLANAVNIARSVYGIYADTKSLEMARQKRDEDSQLTKSQLNGELTSKDLVSSGASDISDEPKPGYLPVLLRNSAENGGALQKYVKIKSGEANGDLQRSKLEAEIARINAETRKTNKEGAAVKLEKTSPDQSKAATFAERLQQAEGVFGGLDNEGHDGTSVGQAFQRTGLVPGMLQTDSFKKRNQAERNFVNALLRRESGSAISDSEFASAEAQYFPRAGDSKDLLSQKFANRQVALAGLQAEAGDTAIGKVRTRVAAMGGQAEAPRTQSLNHEDQQAIAWAQVNPADPRAQQILKMHGANSQTAGR
jgi:hypothetical protein